MLPPAAPDSSPRATKAPCPSATAAAAGAITLPARGYTSATPSQAGSAAERTRSPRRHPTPRHETRWHRESPHRGLQQQWSPPPPRQQQQGPSSSLPGGLLPRRRPTPDRSLEQTASPKCTPSTGGSHGGTRPLRGGFRHCGGLYRPSGHSRCCPSRWGAQSRATSSPTISRGSSHFPLSGFFPFVEEACCINGGVWRRRHGLPHQLSRGSVFIPLRCVLWPPDGVSDNSAPDTVTYH